MQEDECKEDEQPDSVPVHENGSQKEGKGPRVLVRRMQQGASHNALARHAQGKEPLSLFLLGKEKPLGKRKNYYGGFEVPFNKFHPIHNYAYIRQDPRTREDGETEQEAPEDTGGHR